jgi:lipopolysaccharide transport system ATP-binding protein
MALAIKVENVSKKYRLGTINRDMLYKDIQSWWAKMQGKPDPNSRISYKHPNRLEKNDDFWALRSVCFELKQGEVLGVIGGNGAGKSTLLKVLSQITAPSEGRVFTNGRIASLLEVGTGFHQELTGRENVYLNGAILGMSRKEVAKKFDEIVAFSEVEEFIDTPVKRYSSGMYVRLAFAVAAHLETEILLVDEVLAVGDQAFQKKCLGKMQDISETGKTVLFVSHNLGTIKSVCSRGIVLESGELVFDGIVGDALDHYQSLNQNKSNTDLSYDPQSKFAFCSISVMKGEVSCRDFTTDDIVNISIKMKITEASDKISFMFFLNNAKYNCRVFFLEKTTREICNVISAEYQIINIEIPPNTLLPGSYYCEFGFLDSVKVYIDHKMHYGYFNIIHGNNGLGKFGNRELGMVSLKCIKTKYI